MQSSRSLFGLTTSLHLDFGIPARVSTRAVLLWGTRYHNETLSSRPFLPQHVVFFLSSFPGRHDASRTPQTTFSNGRLNKTSTTPFFGWADSVAVEFQNALHFKIDNSFPSFIGLARHNTTLFCTHSFAFSVFLGPPTPVLWTGLTNVERRFFSGEIVGGMFLGSKALFLPFGESAALASVNCRAIPFYLLLLSVCF